MAHHLTAMRKAHVTAVDEPVFDPDNGHCACVYRRSIRSDDAYGSSTGRRGWTQRLVDTVLLIRLTLILYVLLSDCTVDSSFRKEIRSY